jgi:hypothetical protein
MSYEIEELVNGTVVKEHNVGLHPLKIDLSLEETVDLNIVKSDGSIPAFDPNNPLNWNHSNSSESLAWDSSAGTATYTANTAGQDYLAVAFVVNGRISIGYVDVTIK